MKNKSTYFLLAKGLIIGLIFLMVLFFADRGSDYRLQFFRLELSLLHKELGIEKLKSDDINDAIFHFKSMVFLTNKNTENLLHTKSNEWNSFNLLTMGILGNVFFETYNFESKELAYGTAKALYGKALEENGNIESAKKQYTEAALSLGFKVEQIEQYIDSIIEHYTPVMRANRIEFTD